MKASLPSNHAKLIIIVESHFALNMKFEVSFNNSKNYCKEQVCFEQECEMEGAEFSIDLTSIVES